MKGERLDPGDAVFYQHVTILNIVVVHIMKHVRLLINIVHECGHIPRSTSRLSIILFWKGPGTRLNMYCNFAHVYTWVLMRLG